MQRPDIPPAAGGAFIPPRAVTDQSAPWLPRSELNAQRPPENPGATATPEPDIRPELRAAIGSFARQIETEEPPELKFTFREPDTPSTAAQPVFEAEQVLPAEHAGAPLNRPVQCSIQKVQLSPPANPSPSRFISGLSHQVEIPEDPAQPARVRYVEAPYNHPYMHDQLPDLPDPRIPSSPNSITSNYGVGSMKNGESYSFVGLSLGPDHGPDLARALATSVAHSIGPHLFAAIPPSLRASALEVIVNHGDEQTFMYKVPPEELDQFDARQDTHRTL